MFLVTYLSLASFSEYGGLPIMKIPHMDKAVHFIFYFIGSVLSCFFIRERTAGRTPIRKAMIYTALAMAFFGLLIEFLQYFMTYDRSGEILDFMANLTGIVLGLIVVNLWFSAKSGLKWRY